MNTILILSPVLIVAIFTIGFCYLEYLNTKLKKESLERIIAEIKEMTFLKTNAGYGHDIELNLNQRHP